MPGFWRQTPEAGCRTVCGPTQPDWRFFAGDPLLSPLFTGYSGPESLEGLQKRPLVLVVPAWYKQRRLRSLAKFHLNFKNLNGLLLDLLRL